jgi:hypothetical protein
MFRSLWSEKKSGTVESNNHSLSSDLHNYLQQGCCRYFKMSTLSTLMLLHACFDFTTHGAVIPQVARRDSTVGQSVQSHDMSTEALLTLIGVCVAVFGTALTLVLSWPSIKVRWGLFTSRRPHPRHRSRPLSTGTSLDIDSRPISRC